MAMDVELKGKWVEALRSGRYEQARCMLRTDDRFCCLGVLCDVAGLEWDEAVQFRRRNVVDGEEASGFDLPTAFGGRVGINETEQARLIFLNDGDKADFPTIATWIETNL